MAARPGWPASALLRHVPDGRLCAIVAWMSRILRSRRASGYLAGVTGLVLVVGACGDGGERSAEGPPSSTRAAPEASAAAAEAAVRLQEYRVPDGSHPHDVAPAADGTVWYTAQATGRLGRLDPDTGRTEEVPLGEGSAPHGVIVGPDGAPWITDGGLNAIVRVDPTTGAVDRFPLPDDRPAVNLNTATFDRRLAQLAARGRKAARLRGLCRRPGPGLGHRMGR